MLELAVEWATAVIEKFSYLRFYLRTISRLNAFHFAHGVAHPIRGQIGHKNITHLLSRRAVYRPA